jgi:hypothetical protein
MKKLPLVILLFTLAACSSKKDPVSTGDNHNAVIVSMNGVGDLKIGMKRESVEKLLKHKLPLPLLLADSTDGYDVDTVSCKYKDIDYTLMFRKEPQEDSSFITKLYEISSRSPILKTPSGVGIGDDLCKITSAYEDRRIEIMPSYDYTGGRSVRIKGKSEVTLYDLHNDNVIIFSMNGVKVESMKVAIYEGD